MSNTGYTKQNVRLGPTQVGLIASGDVSICTPNVSGKVFTVKHIQATNNDTSTHYLCVSIGPNTAANRIVDQAPIAANGEYARFVNHIVGTSDTGGLCVGADAASKITITVYGILETISG